MKESGASLVEYALLLGLIAVICAGAITILGSGGNNTDETTPKPAVSDKSSTGLDVDYITVDSIRYLCIRTSSSYNAGIWCTEAERSER